LLPPWQGEIQVHGRSVVGLPVWRSISNTIALVPEGKQIFADMSVRENLLIGGYHNPDRLFDLELVLDRFPRLRERLSQVAGTLSGGEQQMLALGRALMARPKMLLLDEPSMGLAPLIVQEVFAEIRKMKDLGMTVLIVEQNAVATLKIADRAYLMETGEIILEGEAADLMHNPEVKRAYLGKGYKEVWE
jgi:branched-chain amino acid transport system ATP-binding protein